MIETLYKQYLKSPKVSTDTRNIEKGSIFFALKGPNFNANEFAQQALDHGASLAVVDEEKYQTNEHIILVTDVLTSLQELAKHHRSQLKIPVIGLTGSNGKTTTKELISAVLSEKYNILATQGNLNNHIGVPLTLLSIRPEHELAVVEMGANHIGEIQDLCALAQPTHGLITNIGKAHLEGFGGFEGVIRAKSELYHYLIQTNGTVWINSQNEILSNMAKRFKNPLFYPAKEDFYHCEFVSADPYVKIEVNSKTLTTQLVGQYNFENIAAALCIGKHFGVPESDANKAITSYQPSNNRSQIIRKGTNTIILDAYNANPSSLNSALENLRHMEGKNKVVILGDMKELGKNSIDEHAKIAKTLSEENLYQIFLVGSEFGSVNTIIPQGHFFKTTQELKANLGQNTFNDAIILIKGSRSIGLEAVVEDL